MKTDAKLILTDEQWDEIDTQLSNAGYKLDGYVQEESSATTSVACPVCANTFIYIRRGNSAEINCQTDGCLRRALRGI